MSLLLGDDDDTVECVDDDDDWKRPSCPINNSLLYNSSSLDDILRYSNIYTLN